MVAIGSAGDIIALTLLAKDLVKAINSSTGAAAEYKGVVAEIDLLNKAFAGARKTVDANQGSPEVQALSDTCARIADKSTLLVDTFARQVRTYEPLGDGANAGKGKRAVKSVLWHFHKSNVDKFRAEIHSHCDALQSCLATTQMSITRDTGKDLSALINTADANAEAFRNSQTAFQDEVRKKFQENQQLIEQRASVWQDRWEWFKQLGSELRSFMSNSMHYTCKIYSDIVTIRKAVLTTPQWSLPGDPFIFEDAFGRRFTFHLNALHSWDVLEHAIEAHFRGRSGHSKVKRLEYSLFESRLSRPVDRELDLDMAIMPGQHITMSLVFHREEEAQGAANAMCPHCGTVSAATETMNVQCTTCLRYFSRVVEFASNDPTQPSQALTYQGPKRPRFGKPAFAELMLQPKMTLRWRAEQTDDDLDDDPDIDDFQRVEIRVRLKPRQEVRPEVKPAQLVSEDASSDADDVQPAASHEVNASSSLDARTESLEPAASSAAEDPTKDDEWAAFDSVKVKAKERPSASNFKIGDGSQKTGERERPRPPSDYRPRYEYYTTPKIPPNRANSHHSSRLDYYSPRYRANDGYGYYAPPQYTYTTSRTSRRTTSNTAYTYTYDTASSSRRPNYHTPAGADAVDGIPQYTEYTGMYGPPPPYYGSYSAMYDTPHPSYQRSPRYQYSATNSRPRPRRPKYASTTGESNSTLAKPRQPNVPPVATEEDARRAGIPAGYSYKNWDPKEEPLLLLGSVFDANSLGKWIYDWAVHHHGAATPITEIAGDLWLLLIQLAGKIKRAEERMPRIRLTSARDMVEDFLESGERLWQRFNKLLRVCEGYMWKERKRDKDTGKVQLGSNGGVAFVESIFGRDRELERTEKLMTGIRLWSMRFDANCGNILDNPGELPEEVSVEEVVVDDGATAAAGSVKAEESSTALDNADPSEPPASSGIAKGEDADQQSESAEVKQPDEGRARRDSDAASTSSSFRRASYSDSDEESAANVALPSTRSPSPEPEGAAVPFRGEQVAGLEAARQAVPEKTVDAASRSVGRTTPISPSEVISAV